MICRRAIVTGASSGIGKAVATLLVSNGHDVVINARDRESLDIVAHDTEREPGRMVVVAGDATKREVIGQLLATCTTCFGSPPSIAVVNAGHGLAGTVLTSDEESWEQLFAVNVIGAMRQMRAFAEVMVQQARTMRQPCASPLDIVVMGSSVGRNVSPFNCVYGASKFAIHGAAEGLRREVAALGVRVSLVEPGVVRTNFQAAAGYDPTWFESYAEEIGPVLRAQDIARTVAFVVEQPPHVHLNEVMVRPTRQPYP